VFGAVPSTLRARAAGIVEFTGGEVYAGSHVIESSVAGVWSAVSDYYLLGFWGTEPGAELRPVRVSVGGRDARIRARRAR
jgi:hypothetical protein